VNFDIRGIVRKICF